MTWFHWIWIKVSWIHQIIANNASTKKIMTRRLVFLIAALLISLVGLLQIKSQPAPAAPEAPARINFQVPSDKPRYNWRVCEDLGVGPVPGVPDTRQRFRLCHNQGWQLLAYCLQPSRPAPEVGTICSRINDDTYWCGEGIQNLQEYAILQTPAPTPTPTFTPTVTPSPSPTGTATSPPQEALPSATPGQPVVRRVARPGGVSIVSASERIQKGELKPTATKTPFLPLSITPTPTQPLHPTPVEQADSLPDSTLPTLNFYGVDFNDHNQRVRIQIIPPNKKVNNGRPIVISFIPGDKCKFGDGHACVSSYLSENLSEVDFLTVHSGVGGEGQAFRHVIEGTREHQAGLSLNQALANLRQLAGAEVVILQGEQVYTGFTLVATARIPARSLKEYFQTPIQSALEAAASIDTTLEGYLNATQPQLVFETCGWKMPGEPWAPGVTSTSASVYLGIIQKSP